MKNLIKLSLAFCFTMFCTSGFAGCYITKGTGGARKSWTATSSWITSQSPCFTSSTPNPSGIGNTTVTISATDTVVYSGNLTLTDVSLDLIINGVLIVTGKLKAGYNTDIKINPAGGKLIVGSYETTNSILFPNLNNTSFDVPSGATFQVLGNMILGKGDKDLIINGLMEIGGTFDAGPSDLDLLRGTGTLKIGGVTCGKLNCASGCPTTGMKNNLTCANFASVLPVVWGTTSATLTAEGALVSWSTYSEKNNAYFDVERSSDGVAWESVGQISANGITEIKTAYSFVDKTIGTGLIYYRVKQVDYDGVYDYSPISVVHVEEKQFITGLYPNPNSGIFFLKLASEELSVIKVRTAQGSEVLTQVTPNKGGYTVELLQARAGFYTVLVQSEGKIYQMKFIVQ